MAANLVILCVSALFVQSVFGQCLSNAGAGFIADNSNYAVNNMGCGCGQGLGDYGLGGNGYSGAAGLAGLAPFAISNGGAFGTSSSSPLIPNGVSVFSDGLLLEGTLSAAGNMPFLTTVGMSGPLPTGGSAGVSYNAGNGNVGILSESTGALGLGAGFGNGAGGNGYGSGATAAGLGYGAGAGLGLGGYGYGSAIGYGNDLGLSPASLAGCACNAMY